MAFWWRADISCTTPLMERLLLGPPVSLLAASEGEAAAPAAPAEACIVTCDVTSAVADDAVDGVALELRLIGWCETCKRRNE